MGAGDGRPCVLPSPAHRFLIGSHVSPYELGGLVVNTCTGYLCPGLTSYLAEDLALGDDLRMLDIAGMGCGGALPNLEAAAGLLAFNGHRPILSIAVEICSATLFMGADPALIVSNSIFGDGAAAMVLRNGETDATGGVARVLDFEILASELYFGGMVQRLMLRKGGLSSCT